MQRIIIGTAGHVDHGKSTLVRALTGTDPDRLPEEKERGMTIDLGFVFLPLSETEEVAIIDVPGHERFLRTMIAGANSIRLVLFVVAADEGIMPQTTEHFDVLKLLGIEKGIIVITKTDKVDAEYVALVQDDIRRLVKDSFLEGAPVFAVSAVTGQGLDELKQAIQAMCHELVPLNAEGIFRCPIDRIFSLKGFGTIVAGTVLSGRISKSDTIEVMPLAQQSRIRNLQVHNESLQEVFAGQRAAFNLTDIAVAELYRGCEITIPDYLKPVEIIDASLVLLSTGQKPLRNNQRVRLHKGTMEVMARITILDKESIQPGETAFVQLRLEKPIVGELNERIVLRSYSPPRVIAGGKLLNLYLSQRGGRFKQERIEYLKTLENITDDALCETVIRYAQRPIADERELMRMTNMPLERVRTQIAKLLARKTVVRLRDNSLVHTTFLGHLKVRALTAIKKFLEENPLKVVMAKSDVVRVLQISHPLLLETVIDELIADHAIEVKGDGIKIPGIGVKLSADAQRLADTLEHFAEKQGYVMFSIKDILDAFLREGEGRIKNVFNYLTKSETFVEIRAGTYLHRRMVERAKETLLEYLKAHGTIRAAEYKDMLGVSRNVARDLLDYFFDAKVTVRVKGTHQLPGAGS